MVAFEEHNDCSVCDANQTRMNGLIRRITDAAFDVELPENTGFAEVVLALLLIATVTIRREVTDSENKQNSLEMLEFLIEHLASDIQSITHRETGESSDEN